MKNKGKLGFILTAWSGLKINYLKTVFVDVWPQNSVARCVQVSPGRFLTCRIRICSRKSKITSSRGEKLGFKILNLLTFKPIAGLKILVTKMKRDL